MEIIDVLAHLALPEPECEVDEPHFADENHLEEISEAEDYLDDKSPGENYLAASNFSVCECSTAAAGDSTIATGDNAPPTENVATENMAGQRECSLRLTISEDSAPSAQPIEYYLRKLCENHYLEWSKFAMGPRERWPSVGEHPPSQPTGSRYLTYGVTSILLIGAAYLLHKRCR